MAGGLLAGCALLAGAHADHVVVTAATPIEQAWQAPGEGPMRAQSTTVPFCRVEGMIEGNIGFELWLPTKFNGRLLGAGVGGDAGVFNYSDSARRLTEGFATVTTDAGHKRTQARWMADPKARVDYEHRAVHLAAQSAKALLARYYGRKADRSYFLGCSGGGRQGLKELQLYPLDYDGIVAGAPGPYMPLQSVRMMWFSLLQQARPEAALTDADWDLYEQRTTRACDALDGVTDGIVASPPSCRFDVAELKCGKGESAACLSQPKVEMLRTITSPMMSEAGTVMDHGLQPGVRTRPGPPSPLLRAMWADGVFDDGAWDATTFQRSRDLKAANRAMPELRADRASIEPFIARGGKALIYQGWADPSTNADPTIDYYTRLTGANGGLEAARSAVRLFMVPGMYHCAGGPGADQFGGAGHRSNPEDPRRDALWAVIDWVEKGRTPEALVAQKIGPSGPDFTRLLCPFPQAARYDGGPSANAASYSCVTDPVLLGLRARMDRWQDPGI
ncbi:tannase/feruloyl esterase family alpha/beta hydrolase [Tsuneonella sp. HG222]